MTSTSCNPIGFGRSAERVLNTPCLGLAMSSRGCTRNTSRRARSSHVRTMTWSPVLRGGRSRVESGCLRVRVLESGVGTDRDRFHRAFDDDDVTGWPERNACPAGTDEVPRGAARTRSRDRQSRVVPVVGERDEIGGAGLVRRRDPQVDLAAQLRESVAHAPRSRPCRLSRSFSRHLLQLWSCAKRRSRKRRSASE